jgi:hypothetical protein
VLLYETGCHPDQLQKVRELNQESPGGSKAKL